MLFFLPLNLIKRRQVRKQVADAEAGKITEERVGSRMFGVEITRLSEIFRGKSGYLVLLLDG